MTRARDVADSALVHIATETFSAASTVSLNNVFSSTYNNYKVIISNGNNPNTANVTFRFRVSGSDNSTANYYMQRSIINQTGTASASSDNGTTSYTLSSNTSGAPIFNHTIDIINPFVSDSRTQLFGFGFSDVSGSYGTRIYGAQFNATTSFDGFSVINSSGNFSGTIRVYGYRN